MPRRATDGGALVRSRHTPVFRRHFDYVCRRSATILQETWGERPARADQSVIVRNRET